MTRRLAKQSNKHHKQPETTSVFFDAKGSCRDYFRGAQTAGSGDSGPMRIGRAEVRPMGGGPGCLVMIAVSIGLSVLLTVVLNLLLR
jgi:hypothetical protein